MSIIERMPVSECNVPIKKCLCVSVMYLLEGVSESMCNVPIRMSVCEWV